MLKYLREIMYSKMFTILLLLKCLQTINSIEIINQSEIIELENSKKINVYKKKPHVLLEKTINVEKIQQISKDIQSSSSQLNVNLDKHLKKSNFNLEEDILLNAETDNFKYENINCIDKKDYNSTENQIMKKSNVLITEKSNVINHNSSQNIYRVMKIKLKNKGEELLQKNEAHKNSADHFKSINKFLIEHDNRTEVTENNNDNLFQIMVNLYNHFYWQTSEIRKRVSLVCGVELIAYLAALHNNYEWAQKVYDSSGHYRGQIMYGNNIWVGQKKFCLEVNQRSSQRKHFNFGFYAANVFINISLPTVLTRIIQLGECLPKSCTTKDVQTVLELDPHVKRLLSLSLTNQNTQIKVTNVRRVPGDFNLIKNIKFRIFLSFIIFIVIVICIGTYIELKLEERKYENDIKTLPQHSNNNTNNNVEMYNGKIFEIIQMNSNESDAETANNLEKLKNNVNENNKFNDTGIIKNDCLQTTRVLGLFERILLCFAFPSNAAAIFSLNRNQEDSVSCVHGIRVLSLLWTIMVHTYLQVFTISENRFRRNITERTFTYQLIGNATFSVDSFFFLSGLLVVLIFLKHHIPKDYNFQEYMKKGIVKSGVLFVYRYLRLTPVYLFVITFNELSLNYVFNRTVFTPTVAHQTCSKYWWRNILYINNFYPLKDLCMIWSWYLANDMQFYLMAIFLLVISTRYLKFTILITITFLITSWGTSGILSIHHSYVHKVSDPFESFDFLYDKPWQRVGTYIIGMMTGYVVYRVKNPPKISIRLNLLLWTFSIGLLFSLIFGVWNGKLSLLATAFYVSIGHTAWGIGLVWITLSCCWGYSPFMNKILSYEGFLPLSRLTYCSYLIHPVIMLITSFVMEGPIHLEHIYIFTTFLGNAVLSFIVAFLISVAFEAPIIRLLKVFLKK